MVGEVLVYCYVIFGLLIGSSDNVWMMDCIFLLLFLGLFNDVEFWCG